MDRDRPPFPAHPLDGAGHRITPPDARPAGTWNAASTRMIALVVLVLRQVNPGATAHQVVSYVRHSTLRDLLDAATIRDPARPAHIMRAMRHDPPADVVGDTVREDRERQGLRLIGPRDRATGSRGSMTRAQTGPPRGPRRRRPRAGSPSVPVRTRRACARDARTDDGRTTNDTYRDADLLVRIGDGDTTAFALVDDRHGRVAYELACHILGTTEAACAVVDEAFVQVWRVPIRRDHPDETARAALLTRVHHCAHATLPARPPCPQMGNLRLVERTPQGVHR